MHWTIKATTKQNYSKERHCSRSSLKKKIPYNNYPTLLDVLWQVSLPPPPFFFFEEILLPRIQTCSSHQGTLKTSVTVSHLVWLTKADSKNNQGMKFISTEDHGMLQDLQSLLRSNFKSSRIN